MANHITSLRKEAGYKFVKQAAQKLDVSSSMLYQIECGYKRPSVSLAMKMCYAYNCQLSDIFKPYELEKEIYTNK